MRVKRISLFVLICLLALPVFGLGAPEAASPKASFSLSGENSDYALGAIIDRDEIEKLPVQETIAGHPAFSSTTRGRSSGSTPPKSFSLKEYAPIPGDQGDQNSCAGWATAYAAKTILESITLGRTNKYMTTRNAYSPIFPYNKARELENTQDKDGGTNILLAVSLLSEYGVPKNTEYGKLKDSRISVDDLKKMKTKGFGILFHDNTSTREYRTQRIKTSLFQGNPVIVGLVFTENSLVSFQQAKERWRPAPAAGDIMGMGHAVCVVGYDDNKYGGSFEIINSWGEFWGDGGYTWIDYNTFDEWLMAAFILNDDFSFYEKPFEWTGKISIQTDGAKNDLPVRFSEDGIYKSKTSQKTGTKIRFVLEGDNELRDGAIYPYVFYTDKNLGKTVQVWPASGNSSSLKIESGKPVTIPGANQWITTNGNVSADNFVFLFSREELDITAIRNSFEKQNGAVMTRLEKAMGDEIIHASNGLYEFSNIKSTFDFLDMESVAVMIFSTQYDKDGKTPLDMTRISGGSFLMGSPKNEPYHDTDEIQRTVNVNDFYMSDSQITVGDFREFVSNSKYITRAEKNGQSYALDKQNLNLDLMTGFNWANPSFSQEESYPVVHISWFDALEYCNWRSKQEGFKPVYIINGDNVSTDNSADGYRLPTEAEWEYACRAGTKTSYNTGRDSISTESVNYFPSANYKPLPVKSYPSNTWGLYEMHGNVYEWTQDQYEGSEYVSTRGGSWGDAASFIRSAYRNPLLKETTVSNLGFRIARSAK